MTIKTALLSTAIFAVLTFLWVSVVTVNIPMPAARSNKTIHAPSFFTFHESSAIPLDEVADFIDHNYTIDISNSIVTLKSITPVVFYDIDHMKELDNLIFQIMSTKYGEIKLITSHDDHYIKARTGSTITSSTTFNFYRGIEIF